MAARLEYRQAGEIAAAFARRSVRHLFLGKSGAILLGYPDTTQDADRVKDREPLPRLRAFAAWWKARPRA